MLGAVSWVRHEDLEVLVRAFRVAGKGTQDQQSKTYPHPPIPAARPRSLSSSVFFGVSFHLGTS